MSQNISRFVSLSPYRPLLSPIYSNRVKIGE
jgi:hypothetical protein